MSNIIEEAKRKARERHRLEEAKNEQKRQEERAKKDLGKKLYNLIPNSLQEPEEPS